MGEQMLWVYASITVASRRCSQAPVGQVAGARGDGSADEADRASQRREARTSLRGNRLRSARGYVTEQGHRLVVQTDFTEYGFMNI